MSELEIGIEKNRCEFQIGALPVIYAVPGLISQVFYNLLSNALKFSKPSAAPVIKIIAEKIKEKDDRFPALTPGDTNYYRIAVSDNGIGFEQQYAEEIFVAFKRLHSYHEFEGTGVGLSICKKIIGNHNGFIVAESRVNEGSTFTMVLPEKPIVNSFS